MSTTIQVRITDSESDLGFCVILYAARFVQSAKDVLTKTGVYYLLHETIKTNKDRSTLKQLWKEITSLMLVLSEKYSSECILDSLVEYPSVFHPICDDSSEVGCSSNQASSSSNNTADSDWQQSEDKSYCTRSSDSALDLCVGSYQMIWVQFLMQNIQVQNQITYQVVKLVSVKDKLNKTLIKMMKSVKKNLQRTSHKKTVKIMTVSIKVIHYQKVSLEFPLLGFFHFLKNIHILTIVYV